MAGLSIDAFLMTSTVATILGLCLGLWRDFQYQIFESSSFARLLGDTARTLGGPTVQMMSMILGISLACSFKSGRQKFAFKHEAWINSRKEKKLKAKAARKARKDGIVDIEDSPLNASDLHPSEGPYNLPRFRRSDSTNSLYSVYGAADAGISAKEAYGIPDEKKEKKMISTGVGSFTIQSSTPSSRKSSRSSLRSRSGSQSGRKGRPASPLKHPQESASTIVSPSSADDDPTATDHHLHLRYESNLLIPLVESLTVRRFLRYEMTYLTELRWCSPAGPRDPTAAGLEGSFSCSILRHFHPHCFVSSCCVPDFLFHQRLKERYRSSNFSK
eukprot:Filipodium_phascolosomae@DN2571_c0_g1_i10.p1